MIVPTSTEVTDILLSIDRLENNLASLMWESFSNDQSYYDVFTDRYLTEDGIDKSKSIYQHNSTNYYLYQPLISFLHAYNLTPKIALQDYHNTC